MASMPEEDLAYVKALVAHNVFQKIRRDMLQFADGVIVVCCCDGDQFGDRIDYLRRLFRDLGCKDRIHFITRHGGALRMAEDSKLNTIGRQTDLDLIDEIREAMDLKKIYSVFLEAHAACGKCAAHNLQLDAAIDELCRARTRAARVFPNALFTKVFHVDSGERKEYYKLSGATLRDVRHQLPFTAMKARFPGRVTIMNPQQLSL